MSLHGMPRWAAVLLAGVIASATTAIVTTWRVSEAYANTARDATEALAATKALDSRMASSELSIALIDARTLAMLDVLKEVRNDVREMRDRK